MDLDSVLDSASTKKEGSKKSNIPTVKAGEELREIVTSYKEVQQKIESLTAKLKDMGETIIANALEEKEKYMIETGTFIKSVKIPTSKKDETVTVVWSDWYSKIPLDAKEEIQNNFPDNYDSYFETNRSIKVKDVTEDDLKELIKRVGKDDFAKFFEVERWISPKTRFTEDQHKLPKDVRYNLNGLVKQKTPSIKTK
jgi:hypothetical protein